MINEENSALVNKTYPLPSNILQFLQTKISEGGERVQGLLNSPAASYGQLKRMKSDIESGIYNTDWSPILKWINSVLGSDRDMLDHQKRTPMEIGMENRFRKTHDKDHNKNLTPLSGKQHVNLRITEQQLNMLKEYYVNEANSTVCQTPDARFHISIKDKIVSCKVNLPESLELTETEAKLLETNIHNAMELVLAKYFVEE